jgi:hypothetical protein
MNDAPLFCTRRGGTADTVEVLPLSDQLRVKQGADALVQLGSRVTGEIIIELVQRRATSPEALTKFDAIARWDPTLVQAAGADRWPSVVSPLTGGKGRRRR